MARRRQRRPSPEKFEQAIYEANNVLIKKWHAEYILLENLEETEDKVPDEELEYLMSTAPGKVPPIVVYPSRAKGRFDIIDGHHRFKAAQWVGLEGLWAVVIDKGSYV